MRRDRRNQKLASPEGWRRYLLAKARQRARKTGVPFSVTEADVALPTRCPVTGEKLCFEPNAPWAQRPSLDRGINALGYVRGNVSIISMRANSIKADMTVAEARRLLFYMEAAELAS